MVGDGWWVAMSFLFARKSKLVTGVVDTFPCAMNKLEMNDRSR